MHKWLCLFFLLCGCQFIGTLYHIGDHVGTLALDDRSMEDDWLDTQINVNIRQKFLSEKASYVLDIEVTVFEGEVLLTGAIPSVYDMEQIIDIVWQTPHVTKVYNYMRLENPDYFVDSAKDALAASSVRSSLMMTQDVRSVNYKLTVDDGVLYILGIAQNQDEYQRVLDAAGNTTGITRIVSFVRPAYEDSPHFN